MHLKSPGWVVRYETCCPRGRCALQARGSLRNPKKKKSAGTGAQPVHCGAQRGLGRGTGEACTPWGTRHSGWHGGGGVSASLWTRDCRKAPLRRLDGRLEEVAKAVGGGYCRLQMPLRLALAVRETVAGHRRGWLARPSPVMSLPPMRMLSHLLRSGSLVPPPPPTTT